MPAKGAGKGVGSKKKKSALKYTVDCTHPVEDGIMDPGNFVRAIGLERYWYWSTGYCPILAGIGQYWVLYDTFLPVIPNTDTGH